MDPPSSSQMAIKENLAQKGQELTQLALTCIRTNHHSRVVKEAQTKKIPQKDSPHPVTNSKTCLYFTGGQIITQGMQSQICTAISHHHLLLILLR